VACPSVNGASTLKNKYMKVRQFEGKNGSVKNQFILNDNEGYEYFQSYNSIIVKRTKFDASIKTQLDETYWNYSTTTSKYRNQFLGETTEQIKKKIKDGIYELVNLN